MTDAQAMLKACPFCGGTDIAMEDNGHAEWLRCNQCGATGPWIEPPEGHDFTGTELADQWNTRTIPARPSSATDGEVERVAAKAVYDAHRSACGLASPFTDAEATYIARKVIAAIAAQVAKSEGSPDHGN